MKPLNILVAAAMVCAAAAIAHAQSQQDDHGSNAMSAMKMGHAQDTMNAAAPAENDTPSTRALKKADMDMMKAMEVGLTGDPDVDFRLKMIPHHRGAIEMAKVALQYGKDRETSVLAKQIIAAQEREIAEMQAWLTEHRK